MVVGHTLSLECKYMNENRMPVKTKYQKDTMELAQQQQVPTVCLEPWVFVRRDIGVQYPA